MLAEKEALLVAVTEEYGRSDMVTRDFVYEDETRRSASLCPFEASLIKRLQAGEMSAFDELVESYQPIVYALSWRILNNPEDARDATQETFIKIYRHFSKFRGDASLKTWICRIAINQARSTERWWRRRRKNETVSLDASFGTTGDAEATAIVLPVSELASPEDETLVRERLRHVECALGRLKKDFRVAVILRDIEGLSYEEIAYATEVSVGTVKSRIARGREMLRVMINTSQGDRRETLPARDDAPDQVSGTADCGVN